MCVYGTAQDVLLHHMLGDLRGGVFVDVGAVDGFSFSNTLFFEQALNWTGLSSSSSSSSSTRSRSLDRSSA